MNTFGRTPIFGAYVLIKLNSGQENLFGGVFYRVSAICWKTHNKLSGQNCERQRLRRTGARARGQSGLYRLIYDMRGGGRRMPCSLWSQLPFRPSFFFFLLLSHRLKLTHPYTFPLPSFQPSPHPAPPLPCLELHLSCSHVINHCG